MATCFYVCVWKSLVPSIEVIMAEMGNENDTMIDFVERTGNLLSFHAVIIFISQVDVKA